MNNLLLVVFDEKGKPKNSRYKRQKQFFSFGISQCFVWIDNVDFVQKVFIVFLARIQLALTAKGGLDNGYIDKRYVVTLLALKL
jgi:hypothetical protein